MQKNKKTILKPPRKNSSETSFTPKNPKVIRRGSSRGFSNLLRLNSNQSFDRPKFKSVISTDPNTEKLYELMKEYQGYDEESLMHSIVGHLEFRLARTRFSIDLNSCYIATALTMRDRLIEIWNDTQIFIREKNPKRGYYLSIEYLLGRSLQNSLLNLEIEPAMKKALMKLGMKLEEIYEMEKDPGLGNGGLGRLAACFLDSLATLNYPAWGYGLRYTFGIFKQKIINGEQVEIPDYWLSGGHPWEIERSDITYEINFYGHTRKEGKYSIWENTIKVKALAYDIPIPGYDTFNTINLRLWKSMPTEELNFNKFDKGDYYGSVDSKLHAEIITSVLYPNDNTQKGRELRLKQQYFFVCASIQDIKRRFSQSNKDFKDFPKKVAIQLNDTHPALGILELLRIFLDEEKMEMNQAWNLVVDTFSYTNHTVLPEALEKWEVNMFGNLLPRHLELVYDINYFWMEKVKDMYPNDYDKMRNMSIIEEGNPKRIRMSNLSIVGSHKVNGVARVHTQILKDRIFKDFYDYDPDKFINMTNGVTQRRWILAANKNLADLYTEKLGTSEWIIDLNLIKSLSKQKNDLMFQKKWQKIKNKNKSNFAKYIKEELKITINPNALFDVMVKRIHEYKRQLLFCFYILHRYKQIKKLSKYEKKTVLPRVFFLGGKSAPAYKIAKDIIKLANTISNLLNNDIETQNIIKFIFLPNYRVSMAEKIIPASDISEHISTAGHEASGTSNMKFAMNGGLIIGTLDGANIEIAEEVGNENMFIFGKKVEDIEKCRERMRNMDYENYFPQSLRDLIAEIRKGVLGDPNLFKDLLGSFTERNDYYLLGTDWEDYLRAQEEVDKVYRNEREWLKRCIHCSTHMGKFSTDRTIEEYATKIWEIQPVDIPEPEIRK